MKEVARKTSYNAISIFIVSYLFNGVRVDGGLFSYLILGLLLTIVSSLLDPVIKVVTLPFNIITLGFLSFLTTLVSLYIIGFFYNNLSILNFTFTGGSFLGVHVSKVYFSGFLSYVAVSATIYFTNKLLGWLFSN